MIPTMRDLLLCATAVVVAMVVAPGVAAGKTDRETQYTFDQVWPTAVRHLRVDEGYKIVDKDADTGYVVFELKDDGKVYSGALEVVQHDENGRKVVKLVLTITDRPDYMEAQVLERMLRKLREEHGDPPPPPAPPPKKKTEKPRSREVREAPKKK